MREERLIQKVKELVGSYTLSIPLSVYLRKYFRSHSEMGGRDRRETREWVFNFFRIGRNIPESDFTDRLCVANFLCSKNSYPSLSYLLATHSGFDENDLKKGLEEKINIVTRLFPSFTPENIFPGEHLSEKIDRAEWQKSFLNKPKVWIRIRKNYRDAVIAELRNAEIPFGEEENPLTLSFSAEVALDKTESWVKGYFEIQDVSSQETNGFVGTKSGEEWWDACAGSGGKSLMILDADPGVKMFATDVRPTTLSEYKLRMKKAGHRNFTTEVIDLTEKKLTGDQMFDGIIADVPCTGSGTWARSPEWLHHYSISTMISDYVALQRKIISKVMFSLKPGAPLVYVTCSVFKKENEENVTHFLNQFPLELEKSDYLQGHCRGSDTLFVARFIKRL